MTKNPVLDFIKRNTMVIALALVVIIFSISTGGKILFAQNINNLISQNGYVFVLAAGMLLCILTGGNIDLSVGSTVCLVGAIAAQLLANTGMHPIVVIFLCLALSVLIGIWQGFWIGNIHIPPFICTLAGMFLFRGLGRAILGSKTVPIANQTFLNIFASYINVPGIDNDTKWSAFIVGIAIAAFLLFNTATTFWINWISIKKPPSSPSSADCKRQRRAISRHLLRPNSARSQSSTRSFCSIHGSLRITRAFRLWHCGCWQLS